MQTRTKVTPGCGDADEVLTDDVGNFSCAAVLPAPVAEGQPQEPAPQPESGGSASSAKKRSNGTTKKRQRSGPVDLQLEKVVDKSYLWQELGGLDWLQAKKPPLSDDFVKRLQGRHLQPCAAHCHIRRGTCIHNPHCLFGFSAKPKDWDEEQQGVWPPNKAPAVAEAPPVRQVDETGRLPAMGLINQGATCYMNSLLQVLAVNQNFVQGLKSWKPDVGAQAEDLDPEHPSNNSSSSDKAAQNAGVRNRVCEELQRWLYKMEFSRKKKECPKALTQVLQCPTGEQQDVNEFNQLLMTLLHDCLQKSSQAPIRQLVANQFRIDCKHCVECMNCHTVSTRPSWCYQLELPVKGNLSVPSALEKYLISETLEGDNQYFCEKCDAKQDALVYTKLCKLPEVFSIHLMRFVFDLKTLSKKKVRDPISFPTTLDMSAYVNSSGDAQDHIYQLTAVLMHKGMSAFSGHYVVQVKDEVDGKVRWSLCDDDWVDAVDPSGVGKVDDWSQPEEPRSKRKSKPKPDQGSEPPGSNQTDSETKLAAESAKDMLSSTSAYMLFYTRSGRRIVPETSDLSHLKGIEHEVKRENEALLEELRLWEAQQQEKERQQAARVHLCHMLAAPPKLQPDATSRKYWIPREWIVDLHTSDNLAKEIQHEHLLCQQHAGACMNPRMLNQWKLVDESFWLALKQAGFSGCHLEESQTKVCADCLKTYLAQELEEHSKQDKKQQLLAKLQTSHSCENETQGDNLVSKAWIARYKRGTDPVTKINQDLVCHHRKLKPGIADSKMVAVSDRTWEELTAVSTELSDEASLGSLSAVGATAPSPFKGTKNFAYRLHRSAGKCVQCSEAQEAHKLALQKHENDVVKPSKKLLSLLNKSEAELCSSGLKKNASYHLLSRKWLSRFRQHLDDYQLPRPETIDNTDLVCQCPDKPALLYDVEASPQLLSQEAGPLTAVREETWKLLLENFQGKVQPPLDQMAFTYSTADGQTPKSCLTCSSQASCHVLEFNKISVKQIPNPPRDGDLAPAPCRVGSKRATRSAEVCEVDVDASKSLNFLQGRIFGALQIPPEQQRLWVSRPGTTRSEISTMDPDTSLQELKMDTSTILEVFDSGKPRKTVSASPQKATPTKPAVELGFAGTALCSL